MTITLGDIHAEASDAAVTATQKVIDRVGEQFGMCGFAWVEVYDIKLNTKMGKAFAAIGFTKAYGKGIQLWNPSNSPTQNIDAKEAGAAAYAAVLQKYGFKSYMGSRLG